ARRSGTDTLSGTGTLRVDAFDLARAVITDMTFTYTRVAVSGPGLSVDLSGTLRAQINIAANVQTVTENFVALDNMTKLRTKTENLVFVDVFTNVMAPSSFTETISGRVFDGVHGFVDVTTTVPFAFSTLEQNFPSSGQLVLRGASTTLRVTAVSALLLTVGLD